MAYGARTHALRSSTPIWPSGKVDDQETEGYLACNRKSHPADGDTGRMLVLDVIGGVA